MNEPLFLLYYWKPATDCSSHSYIGSDISCLFTNLVTIGNDQYKVTLSNAECNFYFFSLSKFRCVNKYCTTNRKSYEACNFGCHKVTGSLYAKQGAPHPHISCLSVLLITAYDRYSFFVAVFGCLADSEISQSERPTNKPKHISVVVCCDRGTDMADSHAVLSLHFCTFYWLWVSYLLLARLFFLLF